MQLSEKACAFLDKGATPLATIAGVTYYQHPTLGDESPLFFIDEEGKLRKSVHWELTDVELEAWGI